MKLNRDHCMGELAAAGIIPRKYHSQVFTVDPGVIQTFTQTVASLYRPGMRIVEAGGGLGYLTESLAKMFPSLDCLEIDEDMIRILKEKFGNSEQGRGMNKKFAQKSHIKILKQDVMTYEPPTEDYLLVGNIPFHLSGGLFRRFVRCEHDRYVRRPLHNRRCPSHCPR